jgi:hypothetical protein
MRKQTEMHGLRFFPEGASRTFPAQRQSKYELFVFFFIGAQRLTNLASDVDVKDYSKLGAL